MRERLHDSPFADVLAVEGEAAELSEGSFHGGRGGERIEDSETLERELKRIVTERNGVH